MGTQKEKVQLARKIVDYLNELVRCDRGAVEELVENRVPCNQAMAEHKTVQIDTGLDGRSRVGMLGILNGLIGVRPDGGVYVVAVFKVVDGGDEEYLVNFEVNES